MGFSARFNIDERKIDERLKRVLFKAMLRIQSIAKRLVPVDTGRLRGSIKLTPTLPGSTLFTLSTNVVYAIDVEFGTKPHVIIPVERKALRFKLKGKEIIVRSVQHPGTRPQPFFRPALFQVKNKELKKIYEEVFK